jgi:hypothetical protein
MGRDMGYLVARGMLAGMPIAIFPTVNIQFWMAISARESARVFEIEKVEWICKKHFRTFTEPVMSQLRFSVTPEVLRVKRQSPLWSMSQVLRHPAINARSVAR